MCLCGKAVGHFSFVIMHWKDHHECNTIIDIVNNTDFMHGLFVCVYSVCAFQSVTQVIHICLLKASEVSIATLETCTVWWLSISKSRPLTS